MAASDWAVQVTATVNTNPFQIKLSWPGDVHAKSYNIFRKFRDERVWNPLGELEGTATTFTDSSVALGTGYEYKIEKLSTGGQETWTYTGYGYIYAGGMLPLVEQRGKVILLVETSVAQTLETELDQFEFDLIADGWLVIRETVNAWESPTSVKERLQRIHGEDPGATRALLLFGHVPVPYSGDITPDEHPPSHLGAWAADSYYADLDGIWTDTTVSDTGAEKLWNWNVPGDGKFDQSYIPSFAELEVGRVDLSNMTCFANKSPSMSEIDLLRRYLDKDHRFRAGLIQVPQRALIYDQYWIREPEGYVAAIWRNYAALVGRNVEQAGESVFFNKIANNWYLWSSVTSAGDFTASALGPNDYYSSDQFAIQDVNAVFTTFLGSRFGDWDNESNFLRASLGASGGVLTSAYAGKPQWLFHHMALGETIGFSTKVTQNNRSTGPYHPTILGTGQVHIGLMGDPTLRMHPLQPVQNLTGARISSGIMLMWEPPTIAGLQGYHVYRASNRKGPYQRISSQLLTSTAYTVLGGRSSEFFMVKPVGLTETPSGSYFNSGQGSYYPDPLAPSLPVILEATALAINANENEPVPITLEGTVSQGTTIRFNILSQPSKGTLSGTPPNLVYTPASHNSGTDTFSYSVSDGTTQSAPSTVTIQIVRRNNTPQAANLSFDAFAGQTLPFTLAGSDVDGDSLIYDIAIPPTKGQLSGDGPNLSYTSTPTAEGTDSFSYTVSDGLSESVAATVIIRIAARNRPPSAGNISFEMLENRSLGIRLGGIDPDGDPILFRITNPPTKGKISGTAPDLIYTPEIGISGTDSFAYIVSDGKTDSTVATVAILIRPLSTPRRINDVRIGQDGWVVLQIQGPPQEKFRILSSSDGKTWIPSNERYLDIEGRAEFREVNSGERFRLFRISWP